jgi:argininosuccinate lyase
MIQHKGDVGMLGPIIKDLIDSSIKNDDQLVKLASIAQKIITADKKTEGQDGFLTEEEKAQLLNDLEDTKHEVEKIDELGVELEEIKKKLK